MYPTMFHYDWFAQRKRLSTNHRYYAGDFVTRPAATQANLPKQSKYAKATRIHKANQSSSRTLIKETDNISLGGLVGFISLPC